MAKKKYIAVFDSGVGGVSVLRELVKLMPGEDYYYFGDSVNAPYGLRTTEEIRQLTMAAAEHLFQVGAKCLVVACNTATAASIAELRELYPDKIIIGIEPALKLAADRHHGGTIGIMATDTTLREKKLADLIQRCREDCSVELIHAPGIVEVVESGLAESPESYDLLSQELGPFIGKLDALVLGCTHYPFVRKTISRILGRDVELLDGGEGTARETKRRLQEAGCLTDGPGSLTIENSSGQARLIELTYQLLRENDD